MIFVSPDSNDTFIILLFLFIYSIRSMVLQNNNNDNRSNNGANNENENHNNDIRPWNDDDHRRGIHVVPVEGAGELHPNNHNNPNRNLLQDLDGWLESNGLRSVDDVLQDDMASDNIQEEECQRIQEEERYAKSIHHKAFYKDMIKEKKEREHKKQIIHGLYDKTMDIQTSNSEIIRNIPLHRMANVCDTIYAMVQNKSLWDNHETTNPKTKPTSSTTSFLQLSLESYPKSTVQEFVNLCIAYDSDDGEDDSTMTGDEKTTSHTKKTKNNSGRSVSGRIHITGGTTRPAPKSSSSSSSIIHALHQIPDDAIVLDCCRIGHYLMAQHIVDTIIHDVLIPSIDTNNCFTLYTLADELNLTSSTLLQRTLSHMIQTIGEYTSATEEDADTAEDHHHPCDEWDHDVYRQELNERLRTMKRALESSVHGHSGGNGSGRPHLYFSSMNEYLSIFAERVQYYRERLYEAKECQRQQQEQHLSSSSSFMIRGRVISSSYMDAEKKIQKQEQRVRTLEIAYAEQKALFRRSSSSGST